MSRTAVDAPLADWPALPYEEWKDTLATLHLWTQIVGKIRLALTPWINHWWHVPLYVTARGLTTSPIPYGTRTFEIDVRLRRSAAADRDRATARRGRSRSSRARWRISTRGHGARSPSSASTIGIRPMPCEIPKAIPFDAGPRARAATTRGRERFWRALVQVERVFKEFRARFIGKGSPVHFFWGSFDLAVTRFSGRPAPAASRAACPTCRTGSRARRTRTR